MSTSEASKKRLNSERALTDTRNGRSPTGAAQERLPTGKVPQRLRPAGAYLLRVRIEVEGREKVEPKLRPHGLLFGSRRGGIEVAIRLRRREVERAEQGVGPGVVGVNAGVAAIAAA